MGVFTTNQVRHFYVANKKVEDAFTTNSKGDISVHQDKDGKIYFKYIGAGGPLRSDLIDPNNGISVKITTAEKLKRACKKAVVTFADGVNLISGKDYVIRIKVLGYYAPANEPALFQFGVVHSTTAMTKEQFYKKMAESLNKNVNKGEEKILEITGDSTGITIEEVPQTNNYKRGVYSVKPINFEIYCNEVTNITTLSDGSIVSEELTWGNVEYSKSAKTVSGTYNLADMEHFYMGERGDIYRDNVAKIGLDTEYMIDLKENYGTMDIHFAFTDSGTESYRSEKDLIIVAEDSVITAIQEDLNNVLNPSV